MGRRAKALWARLRRWMGYVPLRVPGLVFALGALGLLWFSSVHADYLLFPASLIAMGLLLLCMLCSVLGSIALRISLRRQTDTLEDEIETTHIVRTGFKFTRLTL